MKDKIDIEKLFSDKLANHESVVSSKVWSGIQAQIGVGVSSTAVAGKGISVASKWIIGAVSVVAVSTVALVLNYNDTQNSSVEPIQQKSDSTELSVVNSSELTEIKSETEVDFKQTENPIDNTIKNESVNKIQSEDNADLNLTVPVEKLIVKQAVSSGEVKTEKIEKPTKVEKIEKFIKEIKEDSRPTSYASVSPSKNSVQEWKSTNVFSPNNDGINDLFFLETKDLKDFSITIINEKNVIVYISDNPNFKWDGTDYKTGEMVPNGNYGYIVFAFDAAKNPVKLFNSLKISR